MRGRCSTHGLSPRGVLKTRSCSELDSRRALKVGRCSKLDPNILFSFLKQCFHPHTSRESVSPVCKIFMKNMCLRHGRFPWALCPLPVWAPVCTAGPAELPVGEELAGPGLVYLPVEGEPAGPELVYLPVEEEPAGLELVSLPVEEELVGPRLAQLPGPTGRRGSSCWGRSPRSGPALPSPEQSILIIY